VSAVTPSRWRRRLRRALVGLVLLALVLTAVLAVVVTRPIGLALALRIIDVVAPDLIEVASAEGTLRGPIVLEGVRIELDGTSIAIQHAAVEWRLASLLQPPIDVRSVELRGVQVRVVGAGDETVPTLESADGALPLIVREARIEEMELVVGDAAPVRVDRLALAAAPAGDRFEITRFEIEAPAIHGWLEGWIRPGDEAELDVRFGWSYSAAELDLVGHGRARGSLLELAIEHELTAPHPVSLSAHLHEPLDAMRFEAELEVRGLALGPFAAELAGATVDGRITVTGDRVEQHVHGPAVLHHARLGAIELDLDVRHRAGLLELNDVAVTATDVEQLRLSGQVSIADPPRVELTLRFKRLTLPGESGVAHDGAVELTGSLDAWHAAGRFELVSTAGRVPIEVVADGDSEGLVLQRLAMVAAGGSAELTGGVNWAEGGRWSLVGSVVGFDLGELVPDYPGSLAFSIDVGGATLDRVDGLSVRDLGGDVCGLMAAGRAALRPGPDGLWLADADIALGRSRVQLAGTIHPELDLDVELMADDLSELDARLGGAGEARLSAQGALTTIRLDGRAELESFAAGDLTVHGVTVAFEGQRAGLLAVDAAAAQVTYGAVALGRVRAALDGDRGAHSIELQVDGERSLTLRADGAWDGERWAGRIGSLAIDVGLAEHLALAAPVEVEAGRDTLRVERACLIASDARLCGGLTWNRVDGGALEAALDRVPLEWLAPLSGETLSLRGELDGRVDLRLSAEGDPTGELELVASEARVVVVRPGLVDGEMPLERLQVRASADGQSLTGDVEVVLEGGRIVGDVGARGGPGLRWASWPLTGQLSANAELGPLLRPFALGIRESVGRFEAELVIGGDVGDPELSGRARLAGEQLKAPRLNLVVDSAIIDAMLEPSGLLRLTGELHAGAGHLRLEGEQALRAVTQAAGELRLTGERFPISDTPEARILITPDLLLKVEGGIADLTGTVEIPEASVTLTSKSTAVVRPSRDVVIVSGRDQAAATNLPLRADVKARLGDAVSLQGLGLEAKLSGELHVVEVPGGRSVVHGQLFVDSGIYRALGIRLSIDEGILSFNGPVEDVGIRLRAHRDLGADTRAGVEVRGTIDEPQLTIWSEPAMEQSDALSMLLTGRRLSQASRTDTEAMQRAATAAGSSVVIGQLGTRLGLDSAGVEVGDSPDDASLVLGKYISPRLFIAYGIGLYDTSDSFRVRYDVTGRWSLEAESGDESSADLLFVFERGAPPSDSP